MNTNEDKVVDYNNGEWHGWNGGECPVHPLTHGEFVFRDGSICSQKPAGTWCWKDKNLPIICFRVTKPYVETRTVVHSITFNTIDGEPDPASIKMEKL